VHVMSVYYGTLFIYLFIKIVLQNNKKRLPKNTFL
jgi:hypothetical protein